jgi:hypothetical protein
MCFLRGRLRAGLFFCLNHEGVTRNTTTGDSSPFQSRNRRLRCPVARWDDVCNTAIFLSGRSPGDNDERPARVSRQLALRLQRRLL